MPKPQDHDYFVLKSLKDALDLLAGPNFAGAFGGSVNQKDYLWGRLHRIVHAGIGVGGPLTIPNPQLGFRPSLPDRGGLATDGGMGVANASSLTRAPQPTPSRLRGLAKPSLCR